LKNLQFCGKHARVKIPRLWSDINSTANKAIIIQKLWRGWSIRRMLQLAGPCVLKRSLLTQNEEDVVTMEEKDKVHPFDYFAIEEGDKIFWFDVRSIFRLTIDQLQPTNPYTRQPLTIDTRKRLKEYVNWRGLRNLSMFHDLTFHLDSENVIAMRWMLISQILDENLFTEVNPMFFIALNRSQLWEFTGSLRNSMLLWAKEHKSVHSRRNIYYVWINHCWKRQTLTVDTSQNVLRYLSNTILRILKDCKEPYEVCFKILSARYSL